MKVLVTGAKGFIGKNLCVALKRRVAVELIEFDIDSPPGLLEEVGVERQNDLWLRGAFPRSFLADDEAASLRWRESFIDTFLERDIPKLGIRTPAETLRRFWNMLSHFHGQIWNASELARSLAANEKTARHYLDILAGAYMIRVLPAWWRASGSASSFPPTPGPAR